MGVSYALQLNPKKQHIPDHGNKKANGLYNVLGWPNLEGVDTLNRRVRIRVLQLLQRCFQNSYSSRTEQT